MLTPYRARVGSLAAGAQSTFGVGLLFSTLQSAAMGGYGVAVVTSAFACGGAIVGGVAGAVGVVGSAVASGREDTESKSDKKNTHTEDAGNDTESEKDKSATDDEDGQAL